MQKWTRMVAGRHPVTGIMGREPRFVFSPTLVSPLERSKTLSRETFSKLMRLPVSLWNLLHVSLYVQFICLWINTVSPFSNTA